MEVSTPRVKGLGPLPEVLDVLVAGGGPAGTATAFRARELGLTALVIDYDDLMKRIRDYAKEKLILPDFGGGDRMKFPRGGELLAKLCFEPIDKDDMCVQWKGLYAEHDIPAKTPVELTGLERRADGNYDVVCFDHGEKSEARYVARNVVIALGRGVPRRFDIPGNTDGIAYRLTRAEDYVTGPVCVIGGGTSAAECVLAISKAKTVAGEPTAVYWSHRSDKMPRVSKALAGEFFEAYVGRGNIRFFPHSEPMLVAVVGDDKKEYLAVRIDRQAVDSRPAAMTLLEFPKDRVIACIGEDIPEGLLRGFGINMAVGGPKSQKRMVVNRYMETRLPNVFLIGDLLSEGYFVTDDFDADPAGFEEVKRRGNIKAALRDGVLVANVIRQRMDGKTDIDVRIEDVEESPAVVQPAIASLAKPVESPGPPPESMPLERRAQEPAAFLIRVLPGGVKEGEHPIPRQGVVTIGRKGCDLSFDHDTMLADQHASVSHGVDGFFLRDDGSSTGTFLKVPSERKLELVQGDLLRAGRQFLLLDSTPGGKPAFKHFDHTGKPLETYALPEKSIVLGREAPDITLDPGDNTLSRRHLAITSGDGKILVKDLGSLNGTFLRVRSARPLVDGDQFRVGQEVFAFTLRENAVLDVAPPPSRPAVVVAPPPPPAISPQPIPRTEAPKPKAEAQAVKTEAPPAPKASPALQGPAVTFQGKGTFAVADGITVLEVALDNGIEIDEECRAGFCGYDPVRILSGQENLANEVGDQERETLEERCKLEPGPCRLACMLRVKGPVTVEVIRPE
jgi:thioredoxin reductase/ferredoxin/pSer/pThr/pTyr-binding forkhead associated (FHA) protein